MSSPSVKSNVTDILHRAAKRGSIKPIEDFIHKNRRTENFQSINAHDEFGRTPLHIAVDFGHTEIVEILLRYKVEIDCKIVKNNNKNDTTTEVALSTPLHLATKYGRKDIFNMLIKQGANVNLQDEDGKTPLHLAIENNYDVSFAKALLEHKADVNIPTKNGVTPLNLAIKQNNVELMELLAKKHIGRRSE